MKILINVKNKNQTKRYLIDNKIKVKDLINEVFDDDFEGIYSIRKKQIINLDLSFEDQNILNQDILVIKGRK